MSRQNPFSKKDKVVFNHWKSTLPGKLGRGSDYDLYAAWKGGLTPQFVNGEWHMGSRSPETGQLLKSPLHPTYDKMITGEIKSGYTPSIDIKTGKMKSFQFKYGGSMKKYQTGGQAVSTVGQLATGIAPLLGPAAIPVGLVGMGLSLAGQSMNQKVPATQLARTGTQSKTFEKGGQMVSPTTLKVGGGTHESGRDTEVLPGQFVEVDETITDGFVFPSDPKVMQINGKTPAQIDEQIAKSENAASKRPVDQITRNTTDMGFLGREKLKSMVEINKAIFGNQFKTGGKLYQFGGPFGTTGTPVNPFMAQIYEPDLANDPNVMAPPSERDMTIPPSLGLTTFDTPSSLPTSDFQMNYKRPSPLPESSVNSLYPDEPVSESNKMGMTPGDKTQLFSSLVPALGNALMAASSKPERKQFTNPYEGDIRDIMAQRRVNLQPAINELKLNRNTAFQSIDQNTLSDSVRRANRQAVVSDTGRQLGQLRLQEQQMNNQMRAEEASTLNTLGFQDMRSNELAQERFDRDRGQRTNFATAALGQLGDVGINAGKGMNQAYTNEQLMNILGNIGKYFTIDASGNITFKGNVDGSE